MVKRTLWHSDCGSKLHKNYYLENQMTTAVAKLLL